MKQLCNMNHRKIDSAVVFGATGFIGNYLVEALLDEGIKVIAVIRKESLGKLRMAGNASVDILYIDEGIDNAFDKIVLSSNCICFNLLWRGVAGDSRKDYRLQLDNVKTALDIMNILSKKGCRTFIGASSISEFDVTVYGGMNGLALPGRYMYATAKLTMDYMCRIESGILNVDYINAVIGNVYGEYGDDNLLLHNTIIKLLRDEETSFTEAGQWYDFVYIKDVVYALILLARYAVGAVSYYVGSGKERHLKEYLTCIKDKINENAVLGFGKIKSDGYSIPKEMFDISKIKEDAGYCPRNDFEKNINSVIEYYRMKLGE